LLLILWFHSDFDFDSLTWLLVWFWIASY
jgi:hypothetical protein